MFNANGCNNGASNTSLPLPSLALRPLTITGLFATWTENWTNLEQVLIVMKQNQELDFASYDANGDKAFMINVNIPSAGV